MNLQRFRKTCEGQLQTLKTSKSTSPGVQQEPGEAGQSPLGTVGFV